MIVFCPERLQQSQWKTNFAACFSWYRFKVNWIGCRETINFFYDFFKNGISIYGMEITLI